MHFDKVARRSYSAKMNNMANILDGTVMVLLSMCLKYLMNKTGTFVKIRRFLVLR